MEQQVFKYLAQYGPLGIAIAVIIFLTITLFKTSWFGQVMNTIVSGLFKKKKTTEISEFNIAKHELFNLVDFWLHNRIPILSMHTEYRTVVSRRYMKILLKNYKSNVKDFVDSKTYQNMSDYELQNYFMELINKIVTDYEREMLDSGVPKVVIDKMKAKNLETIKLIVNLIEGVCKSDFYTSDKNLLKMYSILNVLLSVLDNMLIDTDVVFNTINGELHGMQVEHEGKIVIEP